MIPIERPDDDATIVTRTATQRRGTHLHGALVEQLEAQFASLCGVRHAIATSSGTTALQLALLAHDIGPDDEVIVTSFASVAIASAILSTGATPVLADIDPATFQIDANEVEAKITPSTRAVIVVHLYGTSADLSALTPICDRFGLILIEDACQALGASWSGRPVGSFGTGCFSLYPTGDITQARGGVLTTNDDGIASRARFIRANEVPDRQHRDIPGNTFTMTDIQAAIGLAQLDNLREWTDERVCNAGTLRRLLEPLPVDPQAVYDDASHVYYHFTIRVHDGRDAVAAYLREHGVGCEVYYPTPIHQQPAYLERGYSDFLPHSERAAREVLSLPVHPAITGEDILIIVRTLADALVRVRTIEMVVG